MSPDKKSLTDYPENQKTLDCDFESSFLKLEKNCYKISSRAIMKI